MDRIGLVAAPTSFATGERSQIMNDKVLRMQPKRKLNLFFTKKKIL